MRIGQRLQQHSIHQAENRGVCADAQRQRQHRHHREPRIFPQGARAVAQVLQQRLQPRPSPLIVGRVLNTPALPSSRRADSRARAGDSPRASRSLAAICKWLAISSASASLRCSRSLHGNFMLRSPREPAPEFPRSPANLRPARALRRQLLLARRAQPVHSHTLVVFRASSPPRLGLPLQPVQRRIEPPRIHLQDLPSSHNRQRDSVTVLRPPAQRLQDQQVQVPCSSSMRFW